MATNTCRICSKIFLIQPQDQIFYNAMDVPEPTLCPQCRLIRRLSFYNMRMLYQDECDLCGKFTLSVYAPDSPYTVYCNSCWWSDRWDPMLYGRAFDFSRPFFEQFKDFMLEVPWMALNADAPNMENSDYCINAGHLKNCYLTFHADFVENTTYCDNITDSKDCFDCNMIDHCELCYASVNLTKCYKTLYSVDCADCHDVYFSRNLFGCAHCFGCVNLRNKQYYWFNEQLTKAEYEKRLAAFQSSSHEAVQDVLAKAQALWNTFPVKYIHGRKNEAVSGDYIKYSKNTDDSFQVDLCENSRYCSLLAINPTKDAYDYLSWGNNAEQIYECVAVGENVSNMKFSYFCWPDCYNIEYSMYAINSHDLFGSINLRKKQHCIFNTQYSPTEYTALRKKIIEHMKETGEWGEFFPRQLSLFAYNESLAQEFFPHTQAEAGAQGFRWLETPKRSISDQPDVIRCAHNGDCLHQCTTAFKLISPEIEFYTQHRLPQPTLCPNCRYYERSYYRNPMQVWERVCQCGGKASNNGLYNNELLHDHESKPCRNTFETAYAPQRPEIVYCEACYNKEVY